MLNNVQELREKVLAHLRTCPEQLIINLRPEQLPEAAEALEEIVGAIVGEYNGDREVSACEALVARAFLDAISKE